MAGETRVAPHWLTEPGPDYPRYSTLSICLRCRDGREDGGSGDRGRARLAATALDAGIGDTGLEILGVHCLGQCKRPCAVALSAPNCFTHLFGDLDPQEPARDLVAPADLYARSPDGFMARKARPEPMKAAVPGRIPPIGWSVTSVETLVLAIHKRKEPRR